MTRMKLCVVNETTDTVENIVLVDPDNIPAAPDGFRYEDVQASRGDALVGGVWVQPPPDMALWREARVIPKPDFLLALKKASILPRNDMRRAALGEWPTTFTGALAGLTEDEQDYAEAEWASATTIRRNHPMIALLAAFANLTDEQVDALFGWTG